MFATPWSRRGFVGDWIARLTARLGLVRDEIRRGIVEAVGRTAAEAAEGALSELIGRWQPPATAPPPPLPPRWHFDDFDPDGQFEDDPDDEFEGLEEREEAEDAKESVALPARPAQCWWKVALVAGLNGLAWWLPRRGASPALATAASLLSAAVLLIN